MCFAHCFTSLSTLARYDRFGPVPLCCADESTKDEIVLSRNCVLTILDLSRKKRCCLNGLLKRVLTIILICICIPIIASAGQSHISAATLGSSIVGSIIFGVIANLICLAIIRYARSLRVGQKSTASKTAQYRATTTTLTKNEAYGMAVYEATDPEHTYDCIPQNSWQV